MQCVDLHMHVNCTTCILLKILVSPCIYLVIFLAYIVIETELNKKNSLSFEKLKVVIDETFSITLIDRTWYC